MQTNNNFVSLRLYKLIIVLICSSVFGLNYLVAESENKTLTVESSTESFPVARGLVGAFQKFAANDKDKVSLILDQDAMGFNRKASRKDYLYVGIGPPNHYKGLEAIPIYTEVIVIIANKRNNVSKLSLRQIKHLLIRSNDNKIVQWREIIEGGSGKITIHGPLTTSEVSRFMMKDIVKDLIGGYEEHDKNADIVKAVSDDPFSLGFLSLGYVPEGIVRILRVSERDSVEIDVPAINNIPELYPLQRDGFLVTNPRETGQVGLASEFSKFVFSKGGYDAILSSGMIPITQPTK